MPLFSISLFRIDRQFHRHVGDRQQSRQAEHCVGYKGSSIQFSDLFYQTLRQNGSGDPIQVGAGTGVSATAINMNSGSPTTTGVPTDVAIMGNGFFVVQQNGMNYYTRAGNFSVAQDGSLQTVNGEQVLGYTAVGGVIPAGAALAPIELDKGQINPPSATSSVQLTTNLDSGAAAGDTPLSRRSPSSSGTAHVLNFNFTKTAAGAWNCNITIPNTDVTPPATWAASTAYTVGQMASPPTANGHFYQCTVAGTSGGTAPSSWPTDGSTFTDGGVTWQDMGTQTSLGTTALTFDSSGKLTTPAGNVSGITASGLADGAADLKFQWNLYNSTGAPLLTQVSGSSTTSSTLQNGFSSGSLTDYSIGADGTIMGIFSNGRTAALGQIALANFANTQGLQRVEQRFFLDLVVGGGRSRSAWSGVGNLVGRIAGAVECRHRHRSFPRSSWPQRDYEADARTITTFDQVMQDTINLKPA